MTFKVLDGGDSGHYNEDVVRSPRLAAFLEALPLAGDEDFVVAPGLGTFRAKHVRRGLERDVIVVHWTGVGLAILQPTKHGVCQHCASSKARSTVCTHCSCAMCTWFNLVDERASPRVSREKLVALARRLQTFELGAGVVSASAPALDDDF